MKSSPLSVLVVMTRSGSATLTWELIGSGASKRLKQTSLQQEAPIPLVLAPGIPKPFITQDLLNGPLKPIRFFQGDQRVVGFDTNALRVVCDIWLRARESGALQRSNQEEHRCDRGEQRPPARGLAAVGGTGSAGRYDLSQ
jgi:hypothetical protein